MRKMEFLHERTLQQQQIALSAGVFRFPVIMPGCRILNLQAVGAKIVLNGVIRRASYIPNN